jgi:hypothetical protein
MAAVSPQSARVAATENISIAHFQIYVSSFSTDIEFLVLEWMAGGST